MTLSVTSVEPKDFDQLAEGLLGFSDTGEEQLRSSMMTTLFVAGASAASDGRCAYLLDEDGTRTWVPNVLKGWIVDLSIVTQTYESYYPVDKLLVRVTACDGTSYVYRCGLDSWTASSFLTSVLNMSRKELAEQVQITLASKGRATFASISCITEQGEFTRVQIPKDQLGKKVSYDAALDAVSWANNTSQSNDESPEVKAQVDAAVAAEEEPFEVAPEELDALIEQVKSPTTTRKRVTKKAAEPSVA